LEYFAANAMFVGQKTLSTCNRFNPATICIYLGRIYDIFKMADPLTEQLCVISGRRLQETVTLIEG
jgi:hypothetical protein